MTSGLIGELPIYLSVGIYLNHFQRTRAFQVVLAKRLEIRGKGLNAIGSLPIVDSSLVVFVLLSLKVLPMIGSAGGAQTLEYKVRLKGFPKVDQKTIQPLTTALPTLTYIHPSSSI